MLRVALAALEGQTPGAWALQEPAPLLGVAGTPGSPSYAPGWSWIYVELEILGV